MQQMYPYLSISIKSDNIISFRDVLNNFVKYNVEHVFIFRIYIHADKGTVLFDQWKAFENNSVKVAAWWVSKFSSIGVSLDRSSSGNISILFQVCKTKVSSLCCTLSHCYGLEIESKYMDVCVCVYI